MKGSAPILGIDFGTSRSAMAWLNPRTGQAEVIKNAEGEDKTPSIVYLGPDGVLVGTPAESMLEEEEARPRVIASAKRLIARPMKLALPDGRLITPVDVVLAILSKLKRDAEEGHFHEPVERAILTCPASFSQAERSALAGAAARAGFATVELLDEPVAAALAYARAGLDVDGHILVYDLGGGTFDLAVLARDDDGFRIALEPRGLRACGGDDFDRALYDHLDEQARRDLNRSISGDDAIDLQILRLCRLRKESLTDRDRCEFSTYLPGGVRFKHGLDRGTFEGLIARHVGETIRLTRAAVEEAEASGQPIRMVVLIGGASRVPMIQRMLATEAGLPIAPQRWQHQDVAVALGAAYYAQTAWATRGRRGPEAAEAGPDRAIAELHRLLEAQMDEADWERGEEQIEPAITIARILALAPEDETALEARRDLARPLLDEARSAVAEIDHPQYGAQWRIDDSFRIAELEIKLGDHDGALETLSKVEGEIEDLDSIRSQIKAFEKASQLLERAGDEESAGMAREAAIELLQEEMEKYADPPANADTSAIENLCYFGETVARLGDPMNAKGWFAAARARVPALQGTPYSKAQQSQDYALTCIAWSQARARDFVGAIATARTMASPISTLWQAVSMRAEQGDIEGAIIDALALPEDYSRNSALEQIAWLLAKDGDLARAMSALRHVTDSVRLTLFRSRVMERRDRTLIEATLDGLLDIAATMPPGEDADRLRASVCLDQAWAQIEWGEPAAARASLDRALSHLAAIPIDGFAYSLAPLYARLGEPALARRWLQVARDTTEARVRETKESYPYRWLAEAQAKAGDFHEALATANEIRDQAATSPRWDTIQLIAGWQARAGQVFAALTTARTIAEGATVLVDGQSCSTRGMARLAVAAEQIRAGDYAGAIGTFKEMEPSIAKQFVIHGIIAACIANGADVPEAENLGFDPKGALAASILLHTVRCLCFMDAKTGPEFMPRA